MCWCVFIDLSWVYFIKSKIRNKLESVYAQSLNDSAPKDWSLYHILIWGWYVWKGFIIILMPFHTLFVTIGYHDAGEIFKWNLLKQKVSYLG